MRFYDHAKIGDSVTWDSVNGYRTGIVRDITPAGVVVTVDGGGDMILSTLESYRNFINRIHPLLTQKGVTDAGAGGIPADVSC